MPNHTLSTHPPTNLISSQNIQKNTVACKDLRTPNLHKKRQLSMGHPRSPITTEYS